VDRLRSAPADAPLALYDFIAYNPWTTEPIPAAGDTDGRMTFFWEPGHFKAAPDTALVRRIILQHPATPGSALDGAGLPAWRDALAQTAVRYRAEHTADVARVRALWDQVCPADGALTDASPACLTTNRHGRER